MRRPGAMVVLAALAVLSVWVGHDSNGTPPPDGSEGEFVVNLSDTDTPFADALAMVKSATK